MADVWLIPVGLLCLGLGLMVGSARRLWGRPGPDQEIKLHRGPEGAVPAAIPREVFEQIADTQPFGLIGPSDFDAWVIRACMRQLAGEESP